VVWKILPSEHTVSISRIFTGVDNGDYFDLRMKVDIDATYTFRNLHFTLIEL
jgi:hypothetical protein